VCWTATDLIYYVDGVMTEHYDISKIVDDYQMFIFLNLAVGAKGSWPGPPDAATKWPENMYVDYVRVYQQ
jgi:beta-glucanase (GH16 family)